MGEVKAEESPPWPSSLSAGTRPCFVGPSATVTLDRVSCFERELPCSRTKTKRACPVQRHAPSSLAADPSGGEWPPERTRRHSISDRCERSAGMRAAREADLRTRNKSPNLRRANPCPLQEDRSPSSESVSASRSRTTFEEERKKRAKADATSRRSTFDVAAWVSWALWPEWEGN